MNVAFYAPLKAPGHPRPSGDRRLARLFVQALEQAGHQVTLATSFRSWDGAGDVNRQRRLQGIGTRLAERFVRRARSNRGSGPPDAWFTYHLYYKAPDWLGPLVSRALGIPYLVAEASIAPKRAEGRWQLGHAATLQAVREAAAVIAVNRNDLPCLRPCLGATTRMVYLPPFLDSISYLGVAQRERLRAHLIERHRLDGSAPLLIAVAMMRSGDKLKSYRILADSLLTLRQRSWQLLIVGSGAAAAQVHAHFAAFPDRRVRFLGLCSQEEIRAWLQVSDLFVWPAVNEAFCMSILEAQAAGLPVVAGASGGVPDIVRNGLTGLLTLPSHPAAFATAIAALLDDATKRAMMGSAARDKVLHAHDLAGAAARLDQLIRTCVGAQL